MLTITFGEPAFDWTFAVQTAGLALSLLTTFIAFQVWRVAGKIRNLDWIKVQNEAWNAYNALKLTSENEAHFRAVDNLVGGRDVPRGILESYPVRAVMFSRMNIMERDFRALLYKLVRNYDGFYLVNEIRESGQNARIIINFLVKSGYDPMFVMFYRRVAREFADKPRLTTMDVDAMTILQTVRRDNEHRRTNDHLEVPEGVPI